MLAFLEHEVTEAIKSGQMIVPGFQPPPQEMPQTMAIGLPPKPELNYLQWSPNINIGGMQIEALKVPATSMALYNNHPVLGGEFRVWHAKAQEEVCLDKSDPNPCQLPAPAPPSTHEGPASKRLKSFVVVPNADLPNTVIHEAVIPKTTVAVLIAPRNKVYLKNNTDKGIKTEPGIAVAEFYKGKWAFKAPSDREHVKPEPL